MLRNGELIYFLVSIIEVFHVILLIDNALHSDQQIHHHRNAHEQLVVVTCSCTLFMNMILAHIRSLLRFTSAVIS